MAAPTAANVAAFLGKAGDSTVTGLAEVHLPLVSAMAEEYTRGQGFTNGDPVNSIRAVIIAATARSVNNPTQDTLQTIGPVQVRAGTFAGWSLAELAVLNSYRKRAS